MGIAVLMEDGTISSSDDLPERRNRVISDADRERLLMWSNDPRIWKPLRY